MNEFQLIDTFTGAFPKVAPPRGPGDDCAVLAPTRRTLCVTTDALVEGVHFTRTTFSLEDVGHKALAVNLSDLAAKGAQPEWAVCALGLPAGVRATDVQALARGMAALAKAHGVELVGGNVSRAKELSVTMTLGGLVPKGRRAPLRSGAKAGDVLYVSGAMGNAAAGLEALTTTRAAGSRTRQRAAALLAEAQRRPAPHVALGRAIAPFASSCIDVSDGLLQDLGHVCDASKVGAEVSSSLLPLSNALLTWTEDVPRAVTLALHGGEDYVLLFTVPAARNRAFRQAMKRDRFVVFRVGSMRRGAGLSVDGRPAKPQGFQHFR